MTHSRLCWTALILMLIALSGCTKKHEDSTASPSPSASPSPEAAPQSNSSSSAVALDDEERKQKLALLDYSTMEDQFINDAAGQWASSAKASSVFDQSSGSASEHDQAENVIGKPDGARWSNDNQDMGFDWLEAGFAKPVHARAVRVVFPADDAVEAVNKLELQDEQGGWHTAWSGLSEVKRDERGPRTWFVREFEKTTYKVKGAKITIANAIQHGYKAIDAVQLVGEEN